MGSSVSYWVCCVCPLSYLFATLWQICLCHKFSCVINWDAGTQRPLATFEWHVGQAPNWNCILCGIRNFPETCWDFSAYTRFPFSFIYIYIKEYQVDLDFMRMLLDQQFCFLILHHTILYTYAYTTATRKPFNSPV